MQLYWNNSCEILSRKGGDGGGGGKLPGGSTATFPLTYSLYTRMAILCEVRPGFNAGLASSSVS